MVTPGLGSRLDFASLLDARGRMLQVHTALPWLALVPEKLIFREALSQPFEGVLDTLASSAHFELKALIGEQISVLLLQADGSYKPFHGYVFEAAQLGSDGGLARYRLVMRPWLSFLGLRRDAFVFQDQTALQIVEAVFRDYPQARFRFDVSQPLRTRSLCTQYRESDLDFVTRLLAEEGLSYHFEHQAGSVAPDGGEPDHARHLLVVSDRLAPRPQLGTARFAQQHPTANARSQKDAVTAFMVQRQLQPQAVTLGSWNYKQLGGTTAETATTLDTGELPRLEVYDGSGAYRYEDAAHAQRAAALALAALELDFERLEGQGSTRHFEAGRQFALIDHPLYGANTTAFNYAGGLLSGSAPADNAFTLLAVEHHATNNLGAQAAQLLQATELEHGSYRNHFHAAPAARAVVPRFVRKPTAPGLQSALVVGLPGEALSTDRDARVKIQFPWQRGLQPNAGGLAPGSGVDMQGHAPGNEASGTWVRVAQAAAGANWGAVCTPRIGSEVCVAFVEGDIDRPLITGGLYNGADTPPFAAGVDAGVNHPGVIDGVHSRGLDGGGYNEWVLDNATGQLRMRLLASYTAAEIGLGHLIQQAAASAQRGAWRGAGFEAGTQGWASVRAGQGLLLSTTAQAGSYGSAQGTQMAAAAALQQLQAARGLGQQLGAAAAGATALGLRSHAAGQALESLMRDIDPQRDGHHAARVNGQAARQGAQRQQTAPVEAFARPHLLLDTPTSALWASEASIAAYAGQDFSLSAHDDLQQTAAHTLAAISGTTTSLYTHEGGIKVHAAHGPVSLQAHTDELQILADQAVTVVSVDDEIRISAKQRIELVAGQSSIVLDGANIDFSCPGNWQVRSSTHAFLPGASGAARLQPLPDSRVKLFDEAFVLVDQKTGAPLADMPYRIRREDGSVETGRTDQDGHTHLVMTAEAEQLVVEVLER